ncbi:GIY-YIG nuclease family protein [Algoriphagus sp. CAU 1675]|uniref:GIY-YIG nuclease family protein n=1 Tax=Algoriphagus sp. CAU 1675 TaxID=3032597 RepID=UPI0023DB7EE3|nr:GIY-YIG nuclease family protein [Algoriphagus sp. CAU 1675]MDF2158205.1 GIY-YIG nuclease family protein [Algoriphagus sp. CAU 1675]
MKKGGAIYIMTNWKKSVLYTGVTNDLIRRVYEHRSKSNPNSFTARYNLSKLVYFEPFHTIEEALAREKQIKAGSRNKKEALINSLNPNWRDLWEDIQKW